MKDSQLKKVSKKCAVGYEATDMKPVPLKTSPKNSNKNKATKKIAKAN